MAKKLLLFFFYLFLIIAAFTILAIFIPFFTEIFVAIGVFTALLLVKIINLFAVDKVTATYLASYGSIYLSWLGIAFLFCTTTIFLEIFKVFFSSFNWRLRKRKQDDGRRKLQKFIEQKQEKKSDNLTLKKTVAQKLQNKPEQKTNRF